MNPIVYQAVTVVFCTSLVFTLGYYIGYRKTYGRCQAQNAVDRQEMLTIMRDSRIGVMGVVAVVMVLLLKTACLGVLSPEAALRAGLLIPLAGRCALVLMVVLLPYVRPEGGLATTLYAGRSPWAVPLALAVLILAGLGVLNLLGGVAVGLSVLAVLLFSWHCRRKIGGATGDTLGASCELAETVLVLALAGQ